MAGRAPAQCPAHGQQHFAHVGALFRTAFRRGQDVGIELHVQVRSTDTQFRRPALDIERRVAYRLGTVGPGVVNLARAVSFIHLQIGVLDGVLGNGTVLQYVVSNAIEKGPVLNENHRQLCIDCKPLCVVVQHVSLI